MSNSYAQPILRTTDLKEAMRVVQQLLDIADTSDLEVDLEARISSMQALRSLMAVLPTWEWQSEGDTEGSSGKGDILSKHLPVRLQSWGLSPESVRPSLFAALGKEPATLRWDFSGWPEAPEIGLGVGGSRGAFVSLCVNVRDLDLAEPATDCTVFVHVKRIESRRAPWLAAQVGLHVIGELVMAPH